MGKKLESMDQGQRIDFILGELGISAAEFARQIGSKEASVSQWRHGKRTMNQTSAEKIHARFPQFSVAFILGLSLYRNEHDELMGELISSFLDSSIKAQGNTRALILLLDAMGYRVTFPHESAESTEEIIAVWSADVGIVIEDGSERPESTSYIVTISKAGEAVQLGISDFKALAGELEDFASVRLNRLFAASENTV